MVVLEDIQDIDQMTEEVDDDRGSNEGRGSEDEEVIVGV